MNKNSILKVLYRYNNSHKNDGFQFVGLFGSYARGTEDIFSDIDLTYKIDHNLFYKDNGFAKLARLEEIKKELESILHKKVDMIPVNTKSHLLQQSLQKEQIKL
jgi:predicted nucleotidyltransferase